jgi:alpha-glucosidase (family GH31 glycosyl hydrolase)
MIRHKPLGSGHPYSRDTDQRFPVDPVAGEVLALGVRSTEDVTAVYLEYELDGLKMPSRSLERTSRKSRGESLDGGHLAAAQAKLAKVGSGWTVSLNGLGANQTLRYRFVSDSGNTRWFATGIFGWEKTDLDLPTAGNSRARGGLDILTDGKHVRATKYQIALKDSEHISGFGERFEATEFPQAVVDTILFEQYKNQGLEKKTYLPMSFAHVIGESGWGFWVDTYRKVSFDIRGSQPESISVTVELDGLLGGDYLPTTHFFDGTATKVLDQFLELVGRPEELPEWVFGLWASGNEWNTQAEVLRQAELHKQTGIPISNLVIEAWSDESSFTAFRDSKPLTPPGREPTGLDDFEFSEKGAWPDPKAMVDALHSQGVKVHLWQIPLLKMRPHPKGLLASQVEEALNLGHLITEPGPEGKTRPYRNRGWWFPLSLMPDLSDAEAAKWWTQKRRYLVRDLGIDGFKTDGGEHAWGRELIYKNGLRGDEMNWQFPVHYAKAYGDLLRSEGKAPVTFSRAGNVGSQAHGAFWAGDENSTWEALRWSLNAGLNASSSGILYWGWDFAGFSGEIPSAELYLRSAAAACFVPIMQYHSEFNHHRTPNRDRTPWNIAERHDDPSVVTKFRKIVELRQRLRPYLESEARKSIATSRPLMRPLWFDYPEDSAIWKSSFQWMLGSSILVAPIVEEGSESREVYLPESKKWVDTNSGEIFLGGQSVRVIAELDRQPTFVVFDKWSALEGIFRPH